METQFFPVDLTEDTLIEVAWQLSGGAGTGGTKSINLKHWLLHFWAVSGELQKIVVEFAEWLDNKRPPRATYHAIMYGRFIGLEKNPGVRPTWGGKTWRRMMETCVLKVEGRETKKACGTEKLCGGMESCIKWIIQVMRLL